MGGQGRNHLSMKGTCNACCAQQGFIKIPPRRSGHACIGTKLKKAVSTESTLQRRRQHNIHCKLILYTSYVRTARLRNDDSVYDHALTSRNSQLVYSADGITKHAKTLKLTVDFCCSYGSCDVEKCTADHASKMSIATKHKVITIETRGVFLLQLFLPASAHNIRQTSEMLSHKCRMNVL